MSLILIEPLLVVMFQKYFLSLGKSAFGGMGRRVFQPSALVSIFFSWMNWSMVVIAASVVGALAGWLVGLLWAASWASGTWMSAPVVRTRERRQWVIGSPVVKAGDGRPRARPDKAVA